MVENPNNVPNADNLGGGGGDPAEDINQYYDDAGETFLPADHVSFLWGLTIFNITMLRFYLAPHGTFAKRSYQTIDRCSRACWSRTPWERWRSTQDSSISWRNWCAVIWSSALTCSHADNLRTYPWQLQHRSKISCGSRTSTWSTPKIIRRKERRGWRAT